MLKILVTPSYLKFKNITNEQRDILETKYSIKFERENIVVGSGEYLYKLIVDLSKEHDIEII